MRNLIVFDQSRWVNHPVSTYRAENKIYQLMRAEKAGLKIPHSYLGNCVPQEIEAKKRYIVKALDTPVFYDGEQEMFTYSIGLTGTELSDAALSAAPVIIQEMIAPKKDLRVTVVGNKLFPAVIQYNGEDIDGDWRKKSKEGLSYSPVELPTELQDKIRCLMGDLDLIFGGIDLAFCDGEYYFIDLERYAEKKDKPDNAYVHHHRHDVGDAFWVFWDNQAHCYSRPVLVLPLYFAFPGRSGYRIPYMDPLPLYRDRTAGCRPHEGGDDLPAGKVARGRFAVCRRRKARWQDRPEAHEMHVETCAYGQCYLELFQGLHILRRRCRKTAPAF